MKKFLSMLAIAAMVMSFVACDDDEATPDGPSIATPAVTNVQVEAAADITFEATIPGGYKSMNVAATGGTAVKKSEPAAGATSGNVVVTFTADATAGAGTVTVSITDNNDKAESETAAINKTGEVVPDVIVVSGVIDEDVTWTADNIYELAGRVIVDDGTTLTIEAGTIIKGREGEGINASALMVARGGKLNAAGTAEKPIIMTSELDDIMPGETAGSNLDEEDKGLWGGLVILGKAPISVSGATEAQIEGVPASETLGLYGGDVANDNSGTISYVSIRHGGTVLSGGSEINGLTLGGVGSGTTINNIEVFANVDDGVEFFGGSVNVSNLLISYQGDDGVDIDQAYAGTLDGFMVIHGGDTDEGLEIDGPEGAANATGKFILKNGTLIGDPTKPSDASSLADFKSKAQGTLENVVFSGYTAGKKIKLASSYDGSCTPTLDAYKNVVDNNLVFTTVQFTGFTVDVYAASGSCDTAASDTAAAAKITSATATGAPAISTWSWTVSAAKSILK
ncbi:hypothetical protein [Chryseolinea sp. H1M3-3]|uniref:hypothetical protein n=1 Tax=Chryseolinea sp. H1M3-3 TaxID=3034144 RepID=UPI0023ED7390|nr:hypothetical protein [Chryseolinea sp. H1M3-3]